MIKKEKAINPLKSSPDLPLTLQGSQHVAKESHVYIRAPQILKQDESHPLKRLKKEEDNPPQPKMDLRELSLTFAMFLR